MIEENQQSEIYNQQSEIINTKEQE